MRRMSLIVAKIITELENNLDRLKRGETLEVWFHVIKLDMDYFFTLVRLVQEYFKRYHNLDINAYITHKRVREDITKVSLWFHLKQDKNNIMDNIKAVMKKLRGEGR